MNGSNRSKTMSERAPGFWPPRCLACEANLEEVEVLYRARVERIRYVPRRGTAGPKMVRAGREELGSFALCAQCWARLAGAR